MIVLAYELRRDFCRSGWSGSLCDRDQSTGQTVPLSAGEEGGAVLPQAKKCRPYAVARAAAFDRKAVGAGKRDS